MRSVTHLHECNNGAMARADRLSGLDSSFLHLERDATHMHVAACTIFEGAPPSYEELLEAVSSRLHLVPRYRQRLAFVPLDQGRPVWVDDAHFNIRFHVRHTALPRPGGEVELKRLAGRIFSQSLDRSKPLWELWLAEGLSDERFAILSKTHHALVDGVSGVDLLTVMFDTAREPAPVAPAEHEWIPQPRPTDVQLLADALLERAVVPGEAIRVALRGPRQLAANIGRGLVGIRAMAGAGISPAPPSPFNVRIGPHRRFTWVRADLAEMKAIKNALGGTVNDVVLAAAAGALGSYMRLHGRATDDLVLKAMVPVSVRVDIERGALGNRVAAMWASLPVGLSDPAQRLGEIRRETQHVKESEQAVGAQVLTQLAGFAPPTIMAQAARLQARQRLFNLVITNVPGPQMPLFALGRELEAIFPMVPLAENTALGIAVMSYNGQMNFGLNADYDALADVETLADELRAAIDELSRAAGMAERRPAGRRSRAGAMRGSTARLRAVPAE